jgi:hypothetical protein
MLPLSACDIFSYGLTCSARGSLEKKENTIDNIAVFL